MGNGSTGTVCFWRPYYHPGFYEGLCLRFLNPLNRLANGQRAGFQRNITSSERAYLADPKAGTKCQIHAKFTEIHFFCQGFDVIFHIRLVFCHG